MRHISKNINVEKYVFLILLGFLLSCNESTETSRNSNLKLNNTELLFTILSPTETNISFKNDLKESLTMNGLFYEYFYNGGGVSVGDVNGDELIDIYFISNLYSNKLYLNQGNLKFKDVTSTSKLKGGYGFPTGVTMVDINADGKLDIYVCKSGKFSDPNKRRNELYVNQGNNDHGVPIFKEQAREYSLDLPHFSTQSAFFDYDMDGDLDMFLINHGLEVYSDEVIESFLKTESEFRGERLFKNDDGKFSDITQQSGIINNMLGFCLGLSIGDLNNDGWPDIVIGQDFSEKDHLYINQKDGTFKEVIEETTNHISNFSMGNDIADFNNDGLLDFISVDMMSESNYDQKTSMSGMNPKRFFKHVNMGQHNQYMYNALQLNNGVPVEGKLPLFSDVAQLSGVSSTDWSWAPLFFDMDNDGNKDLFVSNGIKRDFRNNDFLSYRKKRQEEVIQLKKEGKNFDQKGYVQDILSRMPPRKKVNYFYKNNGDLTFVDKSTNWVKPKETSSNGATYADFDNDGDLDIIVNNSDDFAFIYRNNISELESNNYLQIKLQGGKKNPIGIGTRVVAYHQGKQQILEQQLTRGFQSSVSTKLHFGIGKSMQLDSLTVIWPEGKMQILKNISANQTLVLNIEEANMKFDYEPSQPEEKLFKTLSQKESGIQWSHKENEYDDFEIETLLPHRMSRLGPGLAVSDINGDGLEDFYLGGANAQSGVLYLQSADGKFTQKTSPAFKADKKFEDTGAVFFDADGDGDLDLYVVSGGSEQTAGSDYYQDRLYENLGNGNFKRLKNSIPKITNSGLRVVSGDYDNDGDIDLFVGTRVKPMDYGAYTKSFILENISGNGTILFEDVTENTIPEMVEHTMITDALWVDMDKDDRLDLVVANEWGAIELFINQGSVFKNATEEYGLQNYTGWWYSIMADDIDNDGDLDLVAGNLGYNYKYKASKESPFFMYINDFDENKTKDIVLGYTQDSTVFPLRGRQCSSDQMPFIRKKFETYDAFAKANIQDVYGEKLIQGLQFKVNTFSSGTFINNGKKGFEFTPFENLAQLSSINKILISDFDSDGQKDIVALGNMYGSEVETPRNDASYGTFLRGLGNGKFRAESPFESGLYAGGDIKDAAIIQTQSVDLTSRVILISRNNDNPILIKIL